MNSLASDVFDWLRHRPAWQQYVAEYLTSGHALSEEDHVTIAERLASGFRFPEPSSSPEEYEAEIEAPLSLFIGEVHIVDNINALVGGSRLTFERDGITAVYGDNGSGKSGFARVLKQALRSRQQEAVLTNVYGDDGSGQPRANITVGFGQDTPTEYAWPSSLPPELKQALFFDRSCASMYVTNDNEVHYRPRELRVLDQLITVCDVVRSILDGEMATTSHPTQTLPNLDPQSPSGEFLASLAATTTEEEIERACALGDDTPQALASATSELNLLRSSGVEGERARLRSLRDALTTFSQHIEGLDQLVGAAAVQNLRQLESSASDLRSAANQLARQTFDDELLDGTGSALWRTLWEAAKTFSESEAYPGHVYPVLDADARCVLCQQELEADARSRFRQFASITTSQLEQDASAAEAEVDKRYVQIAGTSSSDHVTGELLAQIALFDDELGSECRQLVEALSRQRSALASRAPDNVSSELSSRAVSQKLQIAIESLIAQAELIDESTYAASIESLEARCRDLQDQVTIANHSEAVAAEARRLRRLAALEEAKRKTATGPITAKATELTRKHVNKRIREQFAAEATPLGLIQVELADVGGQKGLLKHKTRLRDSRQSAPIQRVLSEGEQSALGLAGFLVDIALDESASAVVLDDPVSSLDHLKRSHIASRLVQLASSRQVIIFSHDLVFLRDIRGASEEFGVAFSERTIRNLPSAGPGNCSIGHPWKARDVRQRLGELKNSLEVLQHRWETMDPDDYEKEVADWAGKMSETLERMASQEVAERVYDQSTLHVKPELFRIFGRITEEDDRVYQNAYSKTSEWARRHDKDLAMSYTAPRVEELQEVLDDCRELFKRIRGYQQS